MQVSGDTFPSNHLLEMVLSSLLTLLTTLLIAAWNSIRRDLRRTRVYHYNVMILMFRLLQKLNPDQSPTINSAMIEFMKNSSPSEIKANGKAEYYG